MKQMAEKSPSSLFILVVPLQIILALGNYMNSSKRGAVYGFKLQSLDLVRGVSFISFFFFAILNHPECSVDLSVFFQLLDTKSTDRKLTLLHYIANVVKEKYAQVSLFYNELHYVEKAAAGESHGCGALGLDGRWRLSLNRCRCLQCLWRTSCWTSGS